jgi:hypothetical protein
MNARKLCMGGENCRKKRGGVYVTEEREREREREREDVP